MVELILPYPPSGNHMWKHAKGRHYLTEDAKRYYQVVKMLVIQHAKYVNLEMNLEVLCQLHPPDRRRRDLDNAWKVISDSLTKSNVWQDDHQIKKLTLHWMESVPGGEAWVFIKPSDEVIV